MVVLFINNFKPYTLVFFIVEPTCGEQDIVVTMTVPVCAYVRVYIPWP